MYAGVETLGCTDGTELYKRYNSVVGTTMLK